MTVTHERRTELLAGCPLFVGVRSADLAALAGAATEVAFPAGRVVARQGEIGTGFFVVVDGLVRVIRDGDPVADLGPGEFFGELSVIDGLPRVAQVVTVEPTICLALATWDFERVLLEQPRLALAILRGLAGRLRTAGDHRHH